MQIPVICKKSLPASLPCKSVASVRATLFLFRVNPGICEKSLSLLLFQCKSGICESHLVSLPCKSGIREKSHAVSLPANLWHLWEPPLFLFRVNPGICEKSLYFFDSIQSFNSGELSQLMIAAYLAFVPLCTPTCQSRCESTTKCAPFGIGTCASFLWSADYFHHYHKAAYSCLDYPSIRSTYEPPSLLLRIKPVIIIAVYRT